MLESILNVVTEWMLQFVMFREVAATVILCVLSTMIVAMMPQHFLTQSVHQVSYIFAIVMLSLQSYKERLPSFLAFKARI